MSFANKLKDCRLQKEQSLQEVADAIGVSKAHFWELESGKSKNPSYELLLKVSDYFKVSMGWLLGEDISSTEDQAMKVLFRQLQTLNKDDLQLITLIVALRAKQTQNNE